MWRCKNCGEMLEDQYTMCWKCGADEAGEVEANFEPDAYEEMDDIITADNMILSNAPLNGLYPNMKILGLVCSEVIIGSDLISKALAGVSNIIGVKSESYRSYIVAAREEITSNIIKQAQSAEANAIMGIKFDYESMGSGMFMVGVTGTAVIV